MSLSNFIAFIGNLGSEFSSTVDIVLLVDDLLSNQNANENRNILELIDLYIDRSRTISDATGVDALVEFERLLTDIFFTMEGASIDRSVTDILGIDMSATGFSSSILDAVFDTRDVFDASNRFRSGIAATIGSLEANSEYSLYDSFNIQWKDVKGQEQIYMFSLLPAMQSNLAGSGQTPEVRPGIMKRTSVSIKPFVIPGSPPCYQVLGLENIMLSLTGAFVGNEYLTTLGNTSTRLLEPAIELYDQFSSLGAYDAAKLFEQEVVHLAKVVTIKIIGSEAQLLRPSLLNNYSNFAGSGNPQETFRNSVVEVLLRYRRQTDGRIIFNTDSMSNDPALRSQGTGVTYGQSARNFFERLSVNNRRDDNPYSIKRDRPIIIEYEALIQSFRYFIVKSDRVFYSIDAFILNAKHHTPIDGFDYEYRGSNPQDPNNPPNDQDISLPDPDTIEEENP